MSENISIVDLAKYPAYIHFAQDYLAEHWNDKKEAQEIITESLLQKILPRLWIALEKDQFVGMILLTDDDGIDFPEKVQPWLMGLYVIPERRGKGIGKQLVQYCMQYAKDYGFPYIYLDSVSYGDMYRKMGFEYLMDIPWKDTFTQVFRKKV